MKEKPWCVRTPIGLPWKARFATEEAAWRRVMAKLRRAEETELACRKRLRRAGWHVFSDESIAA